MNVKRRKKNRQKKLQLSQIKSKSFLNPAASIVEVSTDESQQSHTEQIEANENLLTLDLSSIKNFDRSITNILKGEFE